MAIENKYELSMFCNKINDLSHILKNASDPEYPQWRINFDIRSVIEDLEHYMERHPDKEG